jgi:hypothetical protein
MIIEQFTDAAGKIRILWEQPSGVVYNFKFSQEPTTLELETLANERESLEEHISGQPVLSKEVNKEQIIQLVETLKSNPNITANQFNTRLETQPWYIQVEIRYLIYLLGTKLAERKDIPLAGSTEAKFFNGVKSFIVNTPKRKLAKLLLNEYDI